MINRIFDTADTLESCYLDFWEDVVNLESPTGYKEGVDKVGQYFAEKAGIYGFKTEFFPQERSGDNVCMTLNPDAPGKLLVLSGHIDTVHPVGSFGTPACHRVDGKMFGPGAIDCKGGCVAAFYAMHILQSVGYDKRPVMLLLQTDEEGNSALSEQKTVKYMIGRSQDAEAFFNMEGYTPGTAVLWRKGIVRFRFDITGVGAHASGCYNGSSAICEAAHKMIELEKMKDKDGLTCNIGRIQGGTADNSVPEKCWFVADVRFADQDQFCAVKEKVAAVSERSYIGNTLCTVTQSVPRPCMERSERNLKLLKKMNAAFEKAGLPLLTPRGSNGGSDASYVTAAGIPCVDSVGVRGNLIHSTGEYALLDSLKQAAIRTAVAILGMDDI